MVQMLTLVAGVYQGRHEKAVCSNGHLSTLKKSSFWLCMKIYKQNMRTVLRTITIFDNKYHQPALRTLPPPALHENTIPVMFLSNLPCRASFEACWFEYVDSACVGPRKGVLRINLATVPARPVVTGGRHRVLVADIV